MIFINPPAAGLVKKSRPGFIQTYGKAILFIIFVLSIILGITYSVHNARGSQNEPVIAGNGQADGKEVRETVSAPCELKDGIYDCTDDETKLRLIELSKQQIKYTNANKTIKATVTGYSSRAQETDSTPEIAANGENIWKLYQKGSNTCASNDHKIGTKLEIEGLGTCIVRDRMNRRYTGTGRIDFYFGYDTAAAYKWGMRIVNVTI